MLRPPQALPRTQVIHFNQYLQQICLCTDPFHKVYREAAPRHLWHVNLYIHRIAEVASVPQRKYWATQSKQRKNLSGNLATGCFRYLTLYFTLLAQRPSVHFKDFRGQVNSVLAFSNFITIMQQGLARIVTASRQGTGFLNARFWYTFLISL